MWIQVRTIDGKETRTVEDLSRLTKIESLRLKIQDIFNVSPQQQRLFYRGKQVKLISLFALHAAGSFWHFDRAKSWWRVSEWSSLVLLSRFLEPASCFGRNSPIVLAQERGVAILWENVNACIHMSVSFSSCCWGRLACNKCPTAMGTCLFTLPADKKKNALCFHMSTKVVHCKREALKTQPCAPF